jgi:hypothetical protein
MQKVLTIQKASEAYPGLTPSAIRRLIRSGEIHSRKVGAKYLTTPEAIESWLQGETSKQEPEQESGTIRRVK